MQNSIKKSTANGFLFKSVPDFPNLPTNFTMR